MYKYGLNKYTNIKQYRFIRHFTNSVIHNLHIPSDIVIFTHTSH